MGENADPSGKTCIEKFERHMNRMQTYLIYVFAVQKIVPKLSVGVSKDWLEKIGEDIEEIIRVTREIYNRPELGSVPPDPLPVDHNCPDYLMSDHLRARLGRNAPLFDLVNAPFTHPIGTELAMICIDNAWNGYDTLVKELMAEIQRLFPDHLNVKAFKTNKTKRPNLSTDECLKTLKIAPSWQRIREYIALHSDKFHLKPDQAERTFELAKKVRNLRTHQFGEPTQAFLQLIAGLPFADYNLRLLDGELEVTLVFSRNVIEVIQLKAQSMYAMAQMVYGL